MHTNLRMEYNTNPQQILSGQILLTVKCARDLPAVDAGGTSDPYVILKFESPQGKSNKLKTKVIQKNLNPEWNESFNFTTSDITYSSFYFQVWDWNRVRDEELGRATLDLRSAVQPNKSLEFPLALQNGVTSHGTLVVQVTFTPQATLDNNHKPKGAKIPNFRLELPKLDYLPGEPISGFVIFNTTKPKKIANITLRISGKEHVFWSEQHGEQTYYYSQTLYHIDQTEVMIGKPKKEKEKLVLEPKLYRFPFTFYVPPTAPPTFHKPIGNISYKLKGTVDIPMAKDKTFETELMIHRPVHAILRSLKDARDEFVYDKVDGLKINVAVTKRTYMLGEVIQLEFVVDNKNSHKIDKIDIKLKQAEEYHATNGVKHLKFAPVATKIAKEVLPINAGSVWDYGFSLPIPLQKISFSMNSEVAKIVWITHYVACTFHYGTRKRAKVHVPVTLLEPLTANFPDYQPKNVMSNNNLRLTMNRIINDYAKRTSATSRKRKRSTSEQTGLDSCTTAMLKRRCRGLGIPIADNKADLIARIQEYEQSKEASEPLLEGASQTKRRKTGPLDASDKIREGLKHFFGEDVVLSNPEYHEATAQDPGSQKLLYDTTKHGEPFLESHSSDELRAVLNNEEIFTMKGTLDVDPEISLGKATKKQKSRPLQYPIKGEDQEFIESLVTIAPFGRGKDTVVDKSVRNCGHIGLDKFTINNPEWNKMFSTSAQSSLLEEIRQQLSLNNSEITAELYKFLYYPKGSFFKPHVDTQRDPNMFATLVIHLPNFCLGGALTVTHKGVTKTFESRTRRKSSWVAFYSSCTHSVEPIEIGFRCSLVYNLKRTGADIPVDNNVPWNDKVVKLLGRILDQNGDQFTLGHLMNFKYAVSNITASVLKGMDAKLFHAAQQSGKFDLLLVPIQIERIGCGSDFDEDEESNCEDAEQFINEDSEAQFATFVVDPSDSDNQSFAALTAEPLEVKWIEKEDQIKKAKKIASDYLPTGNEGVGALMFYIHAALLVRKRKGNEAITF